MKELPLKDDATKAAIDFLESQGCSVVKWHKFNDDDETTWPKDGQECITEQGYATFYTRDSWTGIEGCWYWEKVSPSLGFEAIHGVIHWCELPKLRRVQQ